jgi:hypothetical protein
MGITLTDAGSYDFQLLVDGQLLSSEDTAVLLTSERAFLYVVDDASDPYGVSQLGLHPAFGGRLAQTRTRAGETPDHWTDFSSTAVVVLIRPDYADFTSGQYRALLDYVSHGGVLVFADPRGALDAQDTPLSPLLPVHILGLRQVQFLPELEGWAREYRRLAVESEVPGSEELVPLDVPDGMDMAAAVGSGQGLTVLSDGGFPLVRWQRFGLGHVCFLAVSPFQEPLHRSGCFVPIWEHVVNHAQSPRVWHSHAATSALEGAVRLLTGYRTPGVAVIMAIALGYALVVWLTLIWSRRCGRQVLGWGLIGALSVCLTVAVLTSAFRSAGGDLARRVVPLSIRSHGPGGRVLCEALVGLFARDDRRVDVSVRDRATRLRGSRAATAELTAGSMVAPVQVRVDAGDRPSLPDVKLRALRAETFHAYTSASVAPVVSAPVLRYTLGGVVLDAWEAPEGVIPSRNGDAFVIGAGGALSGSIRDRICEVRGSAESLLALNPFTTHLGHLFSSRALPAGCLALGAPTDAAAVGGAVELTGDWDSSGYALDLIPAVEVCEPGHAVVVGAEFVRLVPRSAAAGFAYRDGTWTGESLQGKTPDLLFDAVLPPVLYGIAPEEVTVHYRFSNPGGNVDASVSLVALPGHYRFGVAERSLIPGSSTVGGHTVFDATACATAFAVHSGTFRLCFNTRTRQEFDKGADSARANDWRLSDVRIQVRGTLPEASEARRY